MTVPQQHVVIITRPGEAGRLLVDELTHAGIDAVGWPAFEIDLTPNSEAQLALARLATFDCVVFVSSAAVAAVAKMLGDTAWPKTVTIAAVGAATAAAARAFLRLTDDVRVIAPVNEVSGESGSEALWQALQAAAPRRVLIARAQHGREWLAQVLQDIGAAVTSVAVYARAAQPLTHTQRAQLRRWRADGVRTITVFSSSEAVDVMLEHAADDDTDVMRRGIAIATHPRIAQRARQRGVNDVNTVSSSTSLLDTIRSLEFPAP